MALKSILVKPKGTRSVNNRLQCSICKQRFWLTCKYNDHMANHKSVVLFCNICNEYFYDQKLLDEHYLIHKDVINTYDCDKCSKKFLHKHELNQHLQSHNPSVVDEPPVKKRKSVHFNNVLEMKSIVDNFSDEDNEDESFYNRFSSRLIKTRSGRIVKVKRLYEDESEGEDERMQSVGLHSEVPPVDEQSDDFAARDTSKLTIVVPENNKSLAPTTVKKTRELKETEKDASVDSSNLSNVSPVSVNKSEPLKKTVDKKLHVIVEKLPNHVYQEYVQKGNVCLYDKADFTSIFTEGHSANKTVNIKNVDKNVLSTINDKRPAFKTIKEVSRNKPQGVNANVNTSSNSAVSGYSPSVVQNVQPVLISQSLSSKDSTKITATTVTNSPNVDRKAHLPISKILMDKTVSVPNTLVKAQQCPKHVYVKKSNPAKNANSPSSVAKDKYSNTSPHSPPRIGNNFVYIGSNPDMNRIKNALAKFGNLSKDDSSKSSLLEGKCKGVSQNSSVKNCTPSTSKTPSRPTAARAVKSQRCGAGKANSDSKTGILEEKVVDDFIFIKVTPEYMQKMQQTPLDIMLNSRCQQGKVSSASNCKQTCSVTKPVGGKICDNLTTPPKINALCKDIQPVNAVNGSKTVTENRVNLEHQVAAVSSIIDNTKLISMKNAPETSVKDQLFSTGKVLPSCEIEKNQNSKTCKARPIILNSLTSNRKKDEISSLNVPKLNPSVSSNMATLSNINLKEPVSAKIGLVDKSPKGATQDNSSSKDVVTTNGENVNKQMTSHDTPGLTCAQTTTVVMHSNTNTKVSLFNANRLSSHGDNITFHQSDKSKNTEISSNGEITVIKTDGDDIHTVIKNLCQLVSSVDSMKSNKETSSQDDDCIIVENNAPKSITGTISNKDIQLNKIFNKTLLKNSDKYASSQNAPKVDSSKVSAVATPSTDNIIEISSQNDDECVIVMENATKSVSANVSMEANYSNTCMKETLSKQVDRQSSLQNATQLVTINILSMANHSNKVTNQASSKNDNNESVINNVTESVTTSILNKSTYSNESTKERMLIKNNANQKSSLNSSKMTANVSKTLSKKCVDVTSSAKNSDLSLVNAASSDTSTSTTCSKKSMRETTPMEEDCQILLHEASDSSSSNASSITLRPRRPKPDFSAKYSDKQISKQIAFDLASINSPEVAGVKEQSSVEKNNQISSQDLTKATSGTEFLHPKNHLQVDSPVESPKLKAMHKTCIDESSKTNQSHLTSKINTSSKINKVEMNQNENKLSEDRLDVVLEVDKICSVSRGQTSNACVSSDDVSAKDKICEVERSTKDKSGHSSTMSQKLSIVQSIHDEIDMISVQNKCEKSKVEKLLERYKAKIEEKERRKREKYEFKKKVRDFLKN